MSSESCSCCSGAILYLLKIEKGGSKNKRSLSMVLVVMIGKPGVDLISASLRSLIHVMITAALMLTA